MKTPTKILTCEHLIHVQHGMNNEELFKSMITEIIRNENFDIEEINNPKRVFLCKKIFL